MIYVELTIEEAMKRCDKNATVLVAVQDLTKPDVNTPFIKKEKKDYRKLFENVASVSSLHDDFVKQLNLFSEKQDVYNVQPIGFRKIILLRE